MEHQQQLPGSWAPPRGGVEADFLEPKELKYILEIDTKTITESGLVVGIKTPLDIISIALQNKQKKD